MDTQVILAGFELSHPAVMNAGGMCKTADDVKELAESTVDAIIVGSITVDPRDGNEGNVFYTDDDDTFSLNSIGLKNPGMKWYRPHLPEMARIAHDAGKLFIINVAGFTPQEYAELTEAALEGGADTVEQNWGCPNVWYRGAQKPITSYDPELVMETLTRTEDRLGDTINIIGKVSPMEPFLLGRLAALVTGFRSVKAITAVNTFPNAMSYDENGNPRITPGGGFAGFAGPAYLPIAVGQVRQWRNALPDRIAIIGVGGIYDGAGMRQHFLAGAAAVQIGTLCYGGPEGIAAWMITEIKKGYMQLSTF